MHAISSILLTHLSNRLILNSGSSLSLSCPSSRSLTATVRQYSYLNSIPSASSSSFPPPKFILHLPSATVGKSSPPFFSPEMWKQTSIQIHPTHITQPGSPKTSPLTVCTSDQNLPWTTSSTTPLIHHHHIFVYSEKAGRQTASPQETVIYSIRQKIREIR